ncbi:MAG: ATP-grasp domain-containing protein [Candidatus Omnitrophota bacterium]
MRKITIGVTGTGSLIGQAIIKSIKNSIFKDEVRLAGFDYIDGTIGSCWVDTNFLLPDFLKKEISEVQWLAALIDIIIREDISILLIGIDFELSLFAKFKDKIESQTNCKVIVSDSRVVEIADDKYLTCQFLKEHNYTYPKTYLPEDTDIKNIKFPCVLKPRHGAGSKNVRIINSKKELNNLLPSAHDCIVQEFIGSVSQEYTCGVIFFDNMVKEMIVLRRELKNGVTVAAHYRVDTHKVISQYVSNIAMALKPYGACNFQLQLDPEGTPKLFEINSRHSGTTYMRAIFGFKEVEYILSYLLGRAVKKFVLSEGTIKRFYEETFIYA